MERQIIELKTVMDELKKQLESEVKQSNEKNVELITLNKQKFKLMAQVEMNFVKTFKTNKFQTFAY